MKISQALKENTLKLQKKNIPNAYLDAELLLSHIIKKPREYALTHPEKTLTNPQINKFSALIKRRTKGESIAYLTGHKSFYGLDFFVNKNALIPRPETELIVDEVLKSSKRPRRPLRGFIIDVGTGSGCVIISIAKALKEKQLSSEASELSCFSFLAADISKPALAIAQKNAHRHKVNKKIKFYHGNLLDPVIKTIKSEIPNLKSEIRNPKSEIIITANLPYLTPEQIKNSPTIQHEPKLALSAGPDGLKYYRKLFKQLVKLPIDDFRMTILCEIDPNQVKELKQLINNELPNNKLTIKKDLRGHNRLVIISFKHGNI